MLFGRPKRKTPSQPLEYSLPFVARTTASCVINAISCDTDACVEPLIRLLTGYGVSTPDAVGICLDVRAVRARMNPPVAPGVGYAATLASFYEVA